jgi:small subunit ribosomal protein S20
VANIKSQIKRNRQNEVRRQRNKATRSELKTRRRTAEAAARNGDDAALELHRVAVKRIDQAAAKGVIHKNKAARDKSRLARRVAQYGADATS